MHQHFWVTRGVNDMDKHGGFCYNDWLRINEIRSEFRLAGLHLTYFIYNMMPMWHFHMMRVSFSAVHGDFHHNFIWKSISILNQSINQSTGWTAPTNDSRNTLFHIPHPIPVHVYGNYLSTETSFWVIKQVKLLRISCVNKLLFNSCRSTVKPLTDRL